MSERRRSAIVRICILASSSAGNATFVSSGRTRILIDAGLSGREIFTRLEAIGEKPESLDAVLVSHEHGDHVCGLLPVLRKAKASVYLTRLTAPTIDWGKYEPRLQCFQAGQQFCIGDIKIESFTVPHDSVDPVAFCITAGGTRIGVVTDLGYMPDSVRMHLRGTDMLMLESNHDLDMLKVGPYPWSVKQRVMSRHGHLSNRMVSDFLMDGLDSCVKSVVLTHLSEHNNHPAIVDMTAAQALRKRGIPCHLTVTEPGMQSQVWEF
ncbi:MAG: MBL fold metallo-hydrolase [Bryobacteraceae bacterium]|nr:MBL fold metallo-hydrolase [Bryobacteraceae bacterium]